MSLAPPPVHIVLVEATPSSSPAARLSGIGAFVVRRLGGMAALVVGLAVLATVPGLQPLVLGYLLEVSGRVGRTGRLRDGFIGLDAAARLGTIVVAAYVCFLPALFLSSLATDALIIEPNGAAARHATIGFYIATVLALWHIAGALLRGGRLRHFLWPRPIDTARRLFFQRGTFAAARDAAWNFIVALRLPFYYALGLRATICTLVWLALPVGLMFLGRERPAAALGGGLLLTIVMPWLPWLQTQAAVDGGWRPLFAVGAVRRRFRCAPWAATAAVVGLLVTALPLNLLKIELIPREAAWLPGVVFVLFAWPARVALGWVHAFARRRGRPRNFVLVWSARLAVFIAAAAYVLLTYVSQATSWYGRYSLFEQHAVLFPVPFWQW